MSKPHEFVRDPHWLDKCSVCGQASTHPDHVVTSVLTFPQREVKGQFVASGLQPDGGSVGIEVKTPKKDNVHILQNVTQLDLPPDRLLEAALGKLEGVVIVGYDKQGAEYFASSYADGGDVLWLLEKAKLKLLTVHIPK